MTASETDLMTTCPADIEELAAFIDGRLTAERRARVIEHLDTCADCRDIVMTADDVATAEAQQPTNVVHGRFWKRAIPAAAAAAMVSWLFLGPLNKSGMEKLVAAAEAEKERPVTARFSADFPYKAANNMRGANGKQHDEYTMEIAASEVADVEDDASPKKLHAAGVALMHLDDPGYPQQAVAYRQQAVARLEKASSKRPDDPAILTDLAAAYYSVGKTDLALRAADRALAIQETPAAIWNRALALESLERRDDARAAWKRYLVLDPDSEWAAEVQRLHLDEPATPVAP